MKIWALALVAVLAVGCGDSDTPAGPTTAPVSADPTTLTSAQRSAPPPPANQHPRGPRTNQLIVLRSMEVGETRQFDSTCAVDWESSDDSIATVDHNGLVTGVSAGTVRITEVCPEEGNSSVSIEVTPIPRMWWDPEPPTEARVGERPNGFGVRVDDRYGKVGPSHIFSSDPDVFTVEFDGDNHWNIVPKRVGSADLLVIRSRTQEESRETLTATLRIVEGLTRTVVVREAPPPPPPPPPTPPSQNYAYKIVSVSRYEPIIDNSDWLKLRLQSYVSASRFTLSFRFQQGSTHSSCTRSWYSPQPEETEDMTVFPDFCGSDIQWSSVTISPADGRSCEGCGTFHRLSIARTANPLTAPERVYKRENRSRP